jgi:hypothetical protein
MSLQEIVADEIEQKLKWIDRTLKENPESLDAETWVKISS